MDSVNKSTRSRMMAGIRSKNTKPELALRRVLHAAGFRFRLHAKDVVGCPDLVLPKYRAVVFVHGCFWHRHPKCRYAAVPSTRAEFWQIKFQKNLARDAKVLEELVRIGWRTAIIWECALRTPSQVEHACAILATWLHGGSLVLELGESELQAEPLTTHERDPEDSLSAKQGRCSNN